MQLQKFVGESMPAVLSTLKDALGSDAIILANRRVGDHIEIIATGTLDEASIDNAELFDTNNNITSSAATTNDVLLNSVEAVVKTANDDVVGDEENTQQQSTDLSNGNEPPNETLNEPLNKPLRDELTADDSSEEGSIASLNETPDVENSVLADTDAIAEEQMLERSTEVDVGAVVAVAMEENAVVMADSIADRVKAEVQSKLENFHTTMNQRLSQLEVNLWGEKDPVKSKHLQTLLEIGLGAELAVALVNRVDASATYDEALRRSLSDLANTLPVASDRTLTHDGITYVTGPSGSGKTTTLIKLAAQKMALSGSDSVVMICADAKRIGVFESLAAHGNALGVSVVCASTQRELQELLLFYANKELVLVDQPFQDEFIELDIPDHDLPRQDVVGVDTRSVRHLLVLPATIQASVAEGIVSIFSKHSTARCVITNLDRPCRVGELFTTIIRHNLRVAYWSECGDVQIPLNKASAQTLVATAMAMGKRLVPSEDERYLMDLIHPRFSASVVPMLRGNL